jgi:NAD kinase
MLTADGQQLIPLHEGQKIRIQRSIHRTRFIRVKEYRFFDRVKEAFGFGPRV